MSRGFMLPLFAVVLTLCTAVRCRATPSIDGDKNHPVAPAAPSVIVNDSPFPGWQLAQEEGFDFGDFGGGFEFDFNPQQFQFPQPNSYGTQQQPFNFGAAQQQFWRDFEADDGAYGEFSAPSQAARPIPSSATLQRLTPERLQIIVRVALADLITVLDQQETGAGWKSYLDLIALQGLAAGTPNGLSTADAHARLTTAAQRVNDVAANPSYQVVSSIWGFRTLQAALPHWTRVAVAAQGATANSRAASFGAIANLTREQLSALPRDQQRQIIRNALADLTQALRPLSTGSHWETHLRLPELSALLDCDEVRTDRQVLASWMQADPAFGMSRSTSPSAADQPVAARGIGPQPEPLGAAASRLPQSPSTAEKSDSSVSTSPGLSPPAGSQSSGERGHNPQPEPLDRTSSGPPPSRPATGEQSSFTSAPPLSDDDCRCAAVQLLSIYIQQRAADDAAIAYVRGIRDQERAAKVAGLLRESLERQRQHEKLAGLFRGATDARDDAADAAWLRQLFDWEGANQAARERTGRVLTLVATPNSAAPSSTASGQKVLQLVPESGDGRVLQLVPGEQGASSEATLLQFSDDSGTQGEIWILPLEVESDWPQPGATIMPLGVEPNGKTSTAMIMPLGVGNDAPSRVTVMLLSPGLAQTLGRAVRRTTSGTAADPCGSNGPADAASNWSDIAGRFERVAQDERYKAISSLPGFQTLQTALPAFAQPPRGPTALDPQPEPPGSPASNPK